MEHKMTNKLQEFFYFFFIDAKKFFKSLLTFNKKGEKTKNKEMFLGCIGGSPLLAKTLTSVRYTIDV